jgi:membrane protease YdiL (CAAX protease family)
MTVEAPRIPAVRLLHQEGILGLIAVVGLTFREGGPVHALAPRGDAVTSLLVGVGLGLGGAAALWLARGLVAMQRLEAWQREMVRDWTVIDAVAVAVLSGIAEEALIRAVLQPWIGLLAAALLFALLHVVPDRRLWLWPVLALVIGLGFGKAFELYGYPCVAAAHVAFNAAALVRLRPGPESNQSIPNDDTSVQ